MVFGNSDHAHIARVSDIGSSFLLMAVVRYTTRMMEYITHSPEETEALGSALVARILSESGTRGTATIFALSGELGAGKTVFVRGVAKGLGIEDNVTSPTFVLMKIYDIPETHAAGHTYARLVHMDCYRLEGAEELEVLGWHAYAADPKNIIFLEWPEKSAMAIPERAREIHLEALSEDTRKITFNFTM